MGTERPIIRVTQLEQFRKWTSDKYAYIDEASVIDNITGAFAGNDKTSIGTAFHSIVETGCPACAKVDGGRSFNIEGREVILGTQACKEALNYRNEMPEAYHEVRIFHDYGVAMITGCADVVNGSEIHDIKTKFSPVQADSDYSDSCQWKFYCELFGADKFVFDLFIFDGYTSGADVRGCTCVRYNPPIVCYPYDGMKEDNARLLSDFLEWAQYRNLIKYLRYEQKH